MNDTGLVTAYAYDGIEGASEVTKGAVQFWDLAKNVTDPEEQHPRIYDFGLCLEVLEHIPVDLSENVLKTISKHVSKSLVMSWSNDREGIGHVNCQPEENWIKTLEKHGFKLNKEKSAIIKQLSTVEYIRNSVNVFDKIPETPQVEEAASTSYFR